MKKIIFSLIFLNLEAFSEAKNLSPKKHEISYNILDTITIFSINKIVFPKITYLPFHFDSYHAMSPSWGLNFGLMYRFEDYNKNLSEPLVDSSGNIHPTLAWTKHHELFLMGGAYYRFKGNKNSLLDGFYVSGKLGPGFGFSPKYHYVSIVSKPEFGYAFEKGAFVTRLGFGIIYNQVLHESPVKILDFSRLNFFPGVLVHRIIPIFNLSFGFRL